MIDSIEIEYKGIKFDVEFDWVEEDDGVQHVECINEIKYKGVSFMEDPAWHCKVPTEEEYEIAMKELGV